jgi:hypothetical protein
MKSRAHPSINDRMRLLPWILLCFIPFLIIGHPKYFAKSNTQFPSTAKENIHPRPLLYSPDSWPYFLQHLQTEDKPIVDYRGRAIADQEKHFAILTYDVGHADLQQCADALMRLRAEYLFSRQKYLQIGFHFNSGDYYSWTDYRRGIRPIVTGSRVKFIRSSLPSDTTHASLRAYLDIVFAYANTVSLYKELKKADRMETGTVVIFPGHPGHCMILADAAVVDQSDTMFKLVEGYMPAQSIYVLSNPFEPGLNPWYHLKQGGDINTASCTFRSYFLRKFE